MKKDNRKFKNEKGTDEYFWEVLNEQKINTLTKWCLQKYSTIYNDGGGGGTTVINSTVI
jgi:hypothetical protein